MNLASSPSDLALLLSTATFAAEKHSSQRRKNPAKTPYINHPLAVASLIAATLPSPPVHILQAALLHDTVEDTDTSLDEIERVFGRRIRDIVDEVSDDPALEKSARKQAQIDHAPHASNDAKHVKLADKLANLTDLTTQTPVGWTAERVQEYFVWAKRVTDGCKDVNPALASRLDMLYRSAAFQHEGVTLKCHPTYGL